jgi:hypothetical protein
LEVTKKNLYICIKQKGKISSSAVIPPLFLLANIFIKIILARAIVMPVGMMLRVVV